ncbi:MAG: ABC transporter ATP-binding protein, partial [Candidatus Electrothrix sp. AW2]|nr:ABC transporter ATP-binding protein [Candidatus Electrothrix gigas]
MLELRNLNTLYGNIQVLHDISLHVQQGEIITLIGANGAGKSTILMSICGIVPPRSGEILFNGTSLVHMSPNNIVALGLSQVPEGRHIFPELTVAENLDMGAFLRKDTQQIQRDLDHVYTLFPILADRRSQPGGNLSGGEQQMLALSRALMARPRLLLLDEPSMGLAPLVIQQIFDIIQRINREDSTTIFLVEQNAHLA